jgi:uncharacterized protein YndB with AHSA1/START domain
MTRHHSHEIEIQAPVEAVWRALTDAATLTNWGPEQARIDARLGGTCWRSVGDGFATSYTIEAFEPAQHLRLARRPPAAGGPPDGVQRQWGVGFPEPLVEEYELVPLADQTLVRLTIDGIPDDRTYDDAFDGLRRVAEVELRQLQHYLTQHPGATRSITGLRCRAGLEPGEAWTRTVGPRALAISGQPGERYATTTARNTQLVGELWVYAAGAQLVATIENLGDALLMVSVAEQGPDSLVYVALSTWDMPPHARDALKADWTAILTTALAPAIVA